MNRSVAPEKRKNTRGKPATTCSMTRPCIWEVRASASGTRQAGHRDTGVSKHSPSVARESATETRTGSSKAFRRVSFHVQACPVRGCSFAAAFISGNSSSANLLVSCDTTGAVVGTHGHPLFHKRIAFGGGQARVSAAALLHDVRPCVGSSIYFGFADYLWSRRTPMRLRDLPILLRLEV